MNIPLTAIALGALLGSSTAAHAIPAVDLIPYQVGQLYSSQWAQAGLVVRGRGTGFYFTVGGGYSLTCHGSPSELPAENSQAFFTWSGSHDVYISVPPTTPTSYAVAGFDAWPCDTCHWCDFKYRGRAAEASTSIMAGTKGVSFTFNPTNGLETTQADLRQFQMCKRQPRLSPIGCYR